LLIGVPVTSGIGSKWSNTRTLVFEKREFCSILKLIRDGQMQFVPNNPAEG
jgi:hypothetical protein